MAARRKSRAGRAHPTPPVRRGRGVLPKPAKPDGWMFDRIVEQQTYLERLARLEGPRLAASFRDAANRVANLTETFLNEIKGRGPEDQPWTTVRYAEHVDRIAAVYREAAAALEVGGSELMLSVLRFEAEWQAKILFESLPVRVDLAKPPLAQLRAFAKAPIDGHNLADWSQGLGDSARAQAQQIIERGLMRGSGTSELTAEVRSALSRTASQAETVVRTAISHASSGAREAFGLANKSIVVGVRWVSVLDSRTSFQCAALSGKVFRLGEGPRPPAHFNCRSTVVMLQRTARELLTGEHQEVTDAYLEDAGKRATASATVPGADTRAEAIREYRASTTFGQWLKQQPAVTQDRVLGRTRGLLYRQGKVPIDGFVGANYEPLTLEQLAQKWGLSLN